MKRITAILLTLTVFILTLPGTAAALSEEEISAPSAILIDQSSGHVLFEKNADEQRACASVTKIMTLLLVMEALDGGRISMDDTVFTSEHASSMGGSDIWLEVGETMRVDEMLKATVIASANDAAVALAEHISGSESSFVEKMNERAKQLKMKKTVFKNCNGLDEDGHITCARDVAIMSRELLKHKEILPYTGTRISELRGGKTQLVNTNKLLVNYEGITGLKTGTTSKAGACISASAERNGLGLIAVVLGAPSGKQRFSDASALLDFGFANYKMITPALPEDLPTSIPVEKGMSDTVMIKAVSDESVLMNKGTKGKITSKTELPQSVEAPIYKGQQLGKIIFYSEGERLAETAVTADSEVERVSFTKIFTLLLKRLLCIE